MELNCDRSGNLLVPHGERTGRRNPSCVQDLLLKRIFKIFSGLDRDAVRRLAPAGIQSAKAPWVLRGRSEF